MRLDGTMESGQSFNDVGDVNVVDGDGALGAIDGVVDVVDVGVGNNDVFNGVVNNVVNGVGGSVEMLDRTPPIGDVDTPDLSLNSLNGGSGSDASLYGSNIDGNESNDISANDI